MPEGAGDRRGAPTGSLRTSRRAPSVGVLAISALGFLALELRLIASRGPIAWRAPETVISNAPQRQSEPFLVFLRQLGRLVPPEASIAVIGPGAGTEAGAMEDLVAIGQLPRCDVVSWRVAVDGKSPAPRFLAVFRRDHSDDRYRLVASLEGGRLLERKR